MICLCGVMKLKYFHREGNCFNGNLNLRNFKVNLLSTVVHHICHDSWSSVHNKDVPLTLDCVTISNGKRRMRPSNSQTNKQKELKEIDNFKLAPMSLLVLLNHFLIRKTRIYSKFPESPLSDIKITKFTNT